MGLTKKDTRLPRLQVLKGLGKRPATSLVIWLLLAALACGSGLPSPTPLSTKEPLDAKEALRGAVNEMLKLESASFILEHLKGTTALIPGFLEMRKASGVVDIPNKFRVKVEAETVRPRSFVEINVVTIFDQAYITDLITGEWREVEPDSLPFTLTNLGKTLAEIIEAMEAPAFIGSERLRGYDTYRIQGRIRSQDLLGLVPGAGEGFDVQLDLWLEQSGSLLLQVLITGKVVSTDQADTVRRLTLDDINVPVDITPPK